MVGTARKITLFSAVKQPHPSFQEVFMLFLAGEEVSEEKQLRCQKCNHEVQVPKGSSVPKCSKCGHDIFESSEPNGNGDG